jgi:hypothetical protein
MGLVPVGLCYMLMSLDFWMFCSSFIIVPLLVKKHGYTLQTVSLLLLLFNFYLLT